MVREEQRGGQSRVTKMKKRKEGDYGKKTSRDVVGKRYKIRESGRWMKKEEKPSYGDNKATQYSFPVLAGYAQLEATLVESTRSLKLNSLGAWVNKRAQN